MYEKMNRNQNQTTENSLTVKPLNQKLESGIKRLQCSFPIEGRSVLAIFQAIKRAICFISWAASGRFSVFPALL